jgi:hypothetical protein
MGIFKSMNAEDSLSSIGWRRDVLCVAKVFFMGVIHRV